MTCHEDNCPALGDCPDCDHDHSCSCQGHSLLKELLDAAENGVNDLLDCNGPGSHIGKRLDRALLPFKAHSTIDP